MKTATELQERAEELKRVSLDFAGRVGQVDHLCRMLARIEDERNIALHAIATGEACYLAAHSAHHLPQDSQQSETQDTSEASED